MNGPVESLAADLLELRGYLLANGSPSFAATIEQVAPKSLLLAAASLFEEEVLQCVQGFVDELGSVAVSSLVSRRALTRQYHTLFEWDARTATKFFSWFGDDCKAWLSQRAKEEPLATSVRAFLELGQLRNHLVHRNFAAFVLEKTAEEVLDLYATARLFVDELPGLLRAANNAS